MSVSCQICGSKNTQLHIQLEREGKVWDIYKCELCQTEFVYPQPIEDFSKMYDDFYSEQGLKDLMNPNYGILSFPRQVGIIKSLVRKKDVSLLDYGCGGGHFLARLPYRWGKCGVEISAKAREVAEKKHLAVYDSFESVKHWQGYFDVVTMFAVIEHLPNPRETVEKLSKMLKVGGLFVIMTGDVGSLKAKIQGKNWNLYAPPGHLFYFTQDSLDLMMETLNFKKIKHLYTDGGVIGSKSMPWSIPLRVGLECWHGIPYLNKLPIFDTFYGYYQKN